MSTRLDTSVVLLTAALLGAPALAQTSAPAPTTQTAPAQSAAQAAQQARDLAARARTAYPAGSANIDQDLWKQAAAAAEAAVAAEPGNAEYLKLRAEIYTEVGFWQRAQAGWDAYLQLRPDDAAAVKQAATVQYNLGYAAYTRGQLEQAGAFFARCLTLNSTDAACATWVARTALERGLYPEAKALYARALALKPGDKTLTYFAALTTNAGKYGVPATRAFSRAYAELEAGRAAQALAGFQEAARTAPAFIEAHREAGRLALNAGDAQAALSAYTAAAALPNATAADRYNLSVAQEGARYGLKAAQAFRAAYARYTAGDKAGAEKGFLQATQLSAGYAKAWAWLGRVRYEAKNYAGAGEAYGRAVQLDPADKSSAYYLRLSQQGK